MEYARNGADAYNLKKRKATDGKYNESSEQQMGNVVMYPIKYPSNRNNFRYVLAERDPLVMPIWKRQDWHMELPPLGCLYRPVIPKRVLLALHDSATQLKIGENRLTITGFRGYATARATHYVNRGRWYFEVTILGMPKDAAVRIGWGQQHSDTQAPVGYNKFGYCWRSLKGTRFHAGHGRTYGQGYTTGDVLGFFIELPQRRQRTCLPESYKDKHIIKCGHRFYYEMKHCDRRAEQALKILPGSTIEYFKNGFSEGVAYTEIFEGAYYPCVSLFKAAKLQVNFGPYFKYPNILDDYEARGYNERGEELAMEHYLSNLFDLVVAKEQMPILENRKIFA